MSAVQWIAGIVNHIEAATESPDQASREEHLKDALWCLRRLGQLLE